MTETTDLSNTRLEVCGRKGLRSVAFRKTFKNQAAFEKWFDAQNGNVEIDASRYLTDGEG